MKTDDFDYYLPEELIAQTPIKKRDSSKLMILDKNTGEIKHEVFHNIIDYYIVYVVILSHIILVVKIIIYMK